MKIKISFFICLILIGILNLSFTQPESLKQLILIDVSHGQRFWFDPSQPEHMNKNRAEYLASMVENTAALFDVRIGFLNKQIEKKDLMNCKLLFIHVPTSKFDKSELKSIIQFIKNGGSLFLAMEDDYWVTLEDTNVNDIVKPFGMQFGGSIADKTIGGYSIVSDLTPKSYKIPYRDGRIVKGGIPFCFSNASKEYYFGTYKTLDKGGKIVLMGDGMISLSLSSWGEESNHRYNEFMTSVLRWLLD